MSVLTPQERRALRARAHHLHPVVSVGQHGLTPQVVHEIDVALTAHGLIKVRVHADAREVREQMLADVCAQLHASPVQHLGKLLIVWRARDEDDATNAAATPGKAARKPAVPASGQPRRRRAGAAPAENTSRSSKSGAPRPKPRGPGYLTRGDAKAGRPPREVNAKKRPPRRLAGASALAGAAAAAGRPPQDVKGGPRAGGSRARPAATPGTEQPRSRRARQTAAHAAPPAAEAEPASLQAKPSPRRRRR